jgi:tol-pal system protein YbgF
MFLMRATSTASAILTALAVALATLGMSAGCATVQPEAAGSAAEVERGVTDLRAQNAGYVRQIEELQNRIFILEDKLDSRRVVDEQRAAPVLPSRRIAAPAVAAAPPEPASSEEPSNVEYAGEAAAPPARARPLLRLSGSARVAVMTRPDPPLPSEASEPREPVPAEPLQLYRQSLDALRAGHHAAAMSGFRRFLARYPTHDYADNAQYWIGECYYDLKQYHAATREFRRVVERFPRGNKVPDAMLKLGFSHLASGDRRDGRQVLESLRRAYPKHAAAKLAAVRLGEDAEGLASRSPGAPDKGPAPAHVAEAH